MVRSDRLVRPALLPLAAAATTAAATLAAALPAAAAPEPGSAKWVAEQFKTLGLKPADGHGYLASLRAKGSAERLPEAIGILPGSDPMLARDYVVVSARLDPTGEAAVIGTARALSQGAQRPRRTIVFVLSDAPGPDRQLPIPSERIAADLDLGAPAGAEGVILTAADETSLGHDAGDLAAAAGLTVAKLAPDARAADAMALGAPALVIGFDAQGAQAGRFDAYLSGLVAQIADRDARPAWTPGSRFAPPAPRAEQLVTDPLQMPLGRRRQPIDPSYG